MYRTKCLSESWKTRTSSFAGAKEEFSYKQFPPGGGAVSNTCC